MQHNTGVERAKCAKKHGTTSEFGNVKLAVAVVITALVSSALGWLTFGLVQAPKEYTNLSSLTANPRHIDNLVATMDPNPSKQKLNLGNPYKLLASIDPQSAMLKQHSPKTMKPVKLLKVQSTPVNSMNGYSSEPAAKEKKNVQEQASTLPCQASGLCSLGKVRYWSGDFWPTSNFKTAVQACSYQNEVIVISHNSPNAAYQAYDNCRSIGYGHVIWLAESSRQCDTSKKLLPELCCSWTRHEWPPLLPKMLYDRVAFIARTVRLGINSLLLDADVLLFHDVYKYFYSPPLRHATILTMRDGNGYINCGVVRIQNAYVDGPTAYFVAEVVDRSLRWAEDNTSWATTKQVRSVCWDQDVYSDVLISVLIGRPVFFRCWLLRPIAGWNSDHELYKKWWNTHMQLLGGGDPGMLALMNSTMLDMPPGLVHSNWKVPELKYSHVSGPIVVPNTEGKWPDNLGGRGYPPHRGNHSRAWMDLLREDGMKTGGARAPMWPDPELPLARIASSASKNSPGATTTQSSSETFAFMPWWMTGSWSHMGSLGYWLSDLMPTVPQVIAHFVAVPAGVHGKVIVQQAMGRYNWTLAEWTLKDKLYFMDQPAEASPHPPPPTPTPLARRLVAFSPAVNLTFNTQGELVAALKGLVQVAVLTNRSVVWPTLPCRSPWIMKDTSERVPPFEYQGGGIDKLIVPMAGGTPAAPRCMFERTMYLGCLKKAINGLGSMLPTEFEQHYLKLAAQVGADVSHRGAGKLFFGGIEEKLGPQRMLRVAANKVVTRSNTKKDLPVMWLTQLLEVESELGSGASRQYANFHELCCALHPSNNCRNQ